MGVSAIPLLLFAAAQVGSPGPANMVLLATGARFGLRAALPFVAGVALGKQLIIWPIGFGLMALAGQYPGLFSAMKWLSAGYILWLAWKVAHGSLHAGKVADTPPGFWAGMIVHPLNPKAWMMVLSGFAGFVAPDTAALPATAWIAGILFACQLVLHPLWCWGGEKLAAHVAGTPRESVMMLSLAGLTLLSVLFVLITGGQS